MAYSICFIKNISGEEKTINNKIFAIDERYQILDNERISWATNDAVIIGIATGSLSVFNCCGEVEGISNQIDWLKGY